MENQDIDSYPDPLEILEAAEAEAPKVNLRQYSAAMSALRLKGYSFAEVAKWLSKRLNVKITRSQVAYILTTPDAVLDAIDEADDVEREADKLAEQEQLGGAITEFNGVKIGK